MNLNKTDALWVDEGSWHYRLASRYGGLDSDYRTDIVQYSMKVLFGSFTCVMVVVISLLVLIPLTDVAMSIFMLGEIPASIFILFFEGLIATFFYFTFGQELRVVKRFQERRDEFVAKFRKPIQFISKEKTWDSLRSE